MVLFIAFALVVCAGAFAAWHGPGFVTALKAVPARDVPAVKISAVVLPIVDGGPQLPARVFLPNPAGEFAGRRGFPVVIYMPGWGGRAVDNDALLKRIADAGVLVIAVDDVRYDDATAGESAARTGVRRADFDISGPDGADRLWQLGSQRAVIAARKYARVLEALKGLQGDAAAGRRKLPAGQRTAFEALSRADLQNVVAAGFSFGGSAAFEALHSLKGVRAAINIDGWVFGDFSAPAAAKPYLSIKSTNSLPPAPIGTFFANVWRVDARSNRREADQLAQADAREIFVSGTRHGDLSSLLHEGGRWMSWRPWYAPLADPEQVRKTIDTAVVAFLREAFTKNST